MSETYEGSCFCGAVQISVSGGPVAEGFCHCASCRSWSAAPVNAFTLWKPDAVKVLRGQSHMRAFRKTERSVRTFCALCGGHLLTEHPTFGVVDVYAATIPSYRHKPALHVNYRETVLPMADGLPKFRDMPKEMGGSGVLCTE
jgi:hypothetical protein